MNARTRSDRWIWLVLLAAAILFFASCLGDGDENDDAGDDDAQDDDAGGDDDAADDDSGDDDDSSVPPTLIYLDDLPVLRLKGSAYERGYALGEAEAERIVTLYQEYILNWALGLSPEYSSVFRLMKDIACDVFILTDQEMEQMRGVADAVRDQGLSHITLPDGSPMELNENDLCIANTIADFAQIACSSVSAWGSMSTDGRAMIARNLDWDPGPERMLGEQTTVISETPEDESWRFVSVGWPGLIGCYSCINGDGTGVFIHDTLRYNDGFHVRLEPRTLLLRRAVLAAQGATNPAQAVEETLEAGRMDTGNNFHAVCQAAGAFPPAACLETDDNRDHPDGTVTIRTSLDLDVSGTELVDALFVTNHHRKRYPPSSCWRYEAMVARAEEIAAADGAMDLEDALDVMRIVEFEELTVHTIGYRPEDRTLIIRRAGPEQTPSEDKGIQVPWDVLFPW